MPNATLAVPDAIILTGEEVQAKFEQPYAAYRVQWDADLQEWMLTLQVWMQERDYYKGACVRAEFLLKTARNKARHAILGPYKAFWWQLPWLRRALEMRLVKQLVAKENELYMDYCEEYGIPYAVTRWDSPKRLRVADLDTDRSGHAERWKRVGKLLDQASLNPTHSFVIPLELMAVLTPVKGEP